ncbi:PQQ-binding-like beta-propeller repeat protein [Novipirellula artificiosorum]|uniref:Outer membrane biogenesis protein BamB n=1 Tax=Novipirellula artificiosorum TaxID=2528016 RepID=A0A5C6DPJ8_9BACT|nr:PQQ-binding-like beta-propeller repeat protein [Novipirellula artificiosorum]TWU38532.1 outer membrane biogenesis protein BamB [Novipirellula artificiosorum]
MKSYVAFVFLVVLASDGPVSDANWNQFRGPNGDGKSVANSLPVEFDESKNVRWKIAIPDSGWSSPVVWGNEVWLTTGSDEKKELRAICIDLETGKVKRDDKVFDMIERKVDPAYAFDSPHLNSPATPTSVVEEDRVYVSFGSQGIACLDRQTGENIWERRDLRIYQPVRQDSSPIVDDKNLYVAFDGTDQQFFVALDKETGDTRWKVDRNVDTDYRATLSDRGLSPKKGGKPNDNKKSFATATLIEAGGQRQLIAPAAEAIISYDPVTGKELWRTVHPGGFNVAARPIYASGLVFVFTSGLDNYLMGIRPDGTGDVTDSHIAWSTYRSTPEIPSPIVVNDLLFMVTAKGGIARCLDAKTGDEIWKKRLGGDYWASPIFADGKLYFSSKQGEITVLTATGDDPQVLASNKLTAEFIASPAVAGDSLILRSTTHLYCIADGHDRSLEQVASDVYPERREREQRTAKNTSPNEGLAALSAQLREMVKAGKLTRKDAIELYQAAAGK